MMIRSPPASCFVTASTCPSARSRTSTYDDLRKIPRQLKYAPQHIKLPNKSIPNVDQRIVVLRALHDGVIPVPRRLVQVLGLVHFVQERPEHERRVRDHQVPLHLALALLPELPRGTLGKRLARAVLGEVGCLAPLLLDLQYARLVPVLLREDARLGRGREHGCARRGDDDALDGGSVLERGGEDASRAMHSGADELIRVVCFEVKGGRSVGDRIDALDGFVERAFLRGRDV